MKVFLKGSCKRHLKLKGWVKCKLIKNSVKGAFVKLDGGTIIEKEESSLKRVRQEDYNPW